MIIKYYLKKFDLFFGKGIALKKWVSLFISYRVSFELFFERVAIIKGLLLSTCIIFQNGCYLKGSIFLIG